MKPCAKISVRNLDRGCRLNESFLKQMVRRALKLVKSAKERELEIVFLTDPEMRRLNRKYKRSGRSTDVLSFKIDLVGFGSKGCTGQIAVCPATASKNAKVFDSSFEKELILYMIHGILHLAGYDDQTRPEAARMSKRENAILGRICKNRDLSRVLMTR